MIRIRMTRFGKRRSLPYFHIVVAGRQTGRDRQPIEVVGRYWDRQPQEPLGNRYKASLDYDRIKYWIAVGAQPSDTVLMLLGEVLIIFTYFRLEFCQRCPVDQLSYRYQKTTQRALQQTVRASKPL